MESQDPAGKGPSEFFCFAMELLPDELWFVSILIGILFGLVWLIGVIFQKFFNGE